MANKRVLGVFTLNCLQTGHWVRVDYHIVMDWAHVLVIVQYQTDGCSLSCKDGAVVGQSFGQLTAGCLTILEMAVDDRRYPNSLVHFGAISVDFIMWSLCFMKLIELSLGFLSGDHAFTYSFNEVVSLGIIVMRSWWKVGCPQGANQFGIDLWRSWLPLLWDQWEGLGVGSCLLFHLVWEHINLQWFGRIHAGHDVLDCLCRYEFSHSNAWTALTDVPPKELRWRLCTDWTLGWCRMLPMLSVQSYEVL